MLLSLGLIAALCACDGGPTNPALDDLDVARIVISQPSYAIGGAGADGALTSVSPSSADLRPGEVVQLTALNAAGTPVDVGWSSGDQAVATVNATGLVGALRPGTAAITAKSRHTRLTVEVRVADSVVAASPPPVAQPVTANCSDLPHQRLVDVSTPAQLGSALSNAAPGDLIRLASGNYTGRWTIRSSGTASNPISLCGPRTAVLADTRYDAGPVLQLTGASYWVVAGFTVRTGLWGIRLEGSSHNQLINLEVHDIGQEGVGLKLNSSNNRLVGLRIYDTGRRGWNYQQWGEGIYVGSWSGHWQGSVPDRSDNNQILNSHIGPNVTAEHIDVKEGTTGTIVRGNLFDGRGMENNGDRVDSWVLVQGNDGLVEDNRGQYSKSNGFRVWPGDGSWGRRNVFRRNVADVQAGGYGFAIQGSTTVISCDNQVSNAGSGFANLACTN